MKKIIIMLLVLALLVSPAIAKKHKGHWEYDQHRYSYKLSDVEIMRIEDRGWELVSFREGPDFCIICFTYWEYTFKKWIEY